MALVRRTGRRRPDRAVTTVEYAMVLAGVAVLVAAVFVAAPGQIRELYDRALCLVGGDCHQQAGGGPTVDPWDSTDPVTRATWGRMVVLGDSYSSGEGDDDYGVTGSTPGCHASAHGYGPAVARSLGLSDRLTVRACTGATLADLTEPYGDHDQPPQIQAVDGHTSLVMMTLGGNDLGWAGVLANCVEHTALGIPFDPSCRARHDAEVNARIRTIEGRLETAYDRLHRQAPDARIVVLGYPRFFPATPTGDLTKAGLTLVDTATQQWMNTKTVELNRTISQAAKAQDVEFVDTTNALAGHELTTTDPWIYGLDVEPVASLPPIKQVQHDMHPTPAGQAVMAKLAEQQIRHP